MAERETSRVSQQVNTSTGEDSFAMPPESSDHRAGAGAPISIAPQARSIPILAESRADWPAVDELVAQAFGGRPNEVELVRGLRQGPAISRVALLDGRVVGHVMLSRVDLEGSKGGVLTLAPVSVLPAYQRRGVGSALVEDALARAEDAGEPLVVVLGEPGYYSRLGFEPAGAYGIVPPSGVPSPALQVKRLSRYEPSLRGRIVYPRVFRETGTI